MRRPHESWSSLRVIGAATVSRRNVILCANDVTQIGGISRVLHATADGFASRGYGVTLLGMNAIEPERSYQRSSDRAALYPVVVPYSENPPPRAKDAHRWNRLRGEAVGYLRRYLETIDLADTIIITMHVYAMEHLLETALLTGSESAPAVFGMYHNSYEGCMKVGDLGRVVRSYSKANRFLALTEGDADRFAAEGMTNVGHIANPVSLLSEPSMSSWHEREKSVVYVGRFAKEKNVPLLVRLWSRVAPEFPDWTFDIYGIGPDDQEVAREILRCGVASSVRLNGPTQNPERVFAGGRIMVMASEYEGLPVAIVEAGLCGMPIVTYDSCPGMRVLIDDGVSGQVVPRGDEGAFVQRLASLMRDSELNRGFGEAAARRMAMFEPSRIIDEWERLFLLSGL